MVSSWAITASLASSLLLCSSVHAAPTKGDFNVLSFNVAGLPEILQPNGQAGDKTTNTASMGKILAANRDAFDIVHVQEDFNYHATLYQYDTHPQRTSTSGGVPVGSGLNTLSNFPWVEFERVKWEKCNGVLGGSNDCLTPKGFTFMRVRVGDAYVDAYNVHADAGDDTPDLEARRANIQQLANYITATSSGFPVLVFGDTNTRYTRTGDNIRLLASPPTSLTDAWVQLQSRNTPPAAGSDALVCENPSTTNSCETVDKVLYRANSPLLTLAATQFQYVSRLFLNPVNATTLSDHNPVLANFTYTLSPSLRLSEFTGGPHGDFFSDLATLPTAPRLAKVSLRGASRLDAISFSLTNGQTLTHGGSGGSAAELVLDAAGGEVVKEAYVCQAPRDGRTRIFYLRLTTSKGKTVQVGTVAGDCVTLAQPAGESGVWGIVAAAGRSGEEVDRLGFVWAKY